MTLVMVAVVLAAPCRAWGEGVTIIMHGWNVADGEPAWTGAMQTAIADQHLGGDQHFGTIIVTGTHNNLNVTLSPWNVDLTSSTSGEIVIRVDWSAVANHLTALVPAQEVAAAIAPKIYLGQQGAPPLAELPVHLIGHSRGGGMVCEIARLLGQRGIEVAHVTPLDPHPLTEADPQPLPPVPPVIDTAVAVFENVLFVDSYWQNIDYPEGEHVSGAYNRLWSSMPGGYHNHPDPAYQDFADHLNVLLAYHGTVDLNTPTFNGEASLTAAERSSWFNTYETDGGVGGQRAGFYYSRIVGEADLLSADTPVGGGDEIRDGYHDDPLLGGHGARSTLDWSGAAWPNVVVIWLLSDGTPLGPGVHDVTLGETLDVDLVYRDPDSASTLTLFADADRNPYNANTIETYSSDVLSATGATLTTTGASWNTSTLADGTTAYLCAQITDQDHTRHLYAAPGIHVVAAPTADLAITKSDGVDLVIPGEQVRYTITVVNNGPDGVTGATVTDSFPAAISSVVWTCTGAGGGGCTASGAGDIADSVALPVAASVTYVATATIDPGATGSLVNTATVAPPAGTGDPVGSNDSATDTDTLAPDGIFIDGFESGDVSRWSG